MIIVLRALLGLGCIGLGLLASCSLYAASEGGHADLLDLLPMMGTAALISCVCFTACRALLEGTIHQLLLGAVGSYMAMLIALLICSWARGEMAETQMWLPIIILFGVPFLAPVVAMSGMGVGLMWPRREP